MIIIITIMLIIIMIIIIIIIIIIITVIIIIIATYIAHFSWWAWSNALYKSLAGLLYYYCTIE